MDFHGYFIEILFSTGLNGFRLIFHWNFHRISTEIFIEFQPVQTWRFWTKKKNEWTWGLLMKILKFWLLILITTNRLSFTVCSHPFPYVYIWNLNLIYNWSHWYSIETAIEFQQDFQWISICISLIFQLVIQRISISISMKIQVFSLKFKLDFQLISIGISFVFKLEFHWNFNLVKTYFQEFPLVFYWKFNLISNGFALELHWNFNWISNGFQLVFNWNFTWISN